MFSRFTKDKDLFFAVLSVNINLKRFSEYIHCTRRSLNLPADLHVSTEK